MLGEAAMVEEVLWTFLNSSIAFLPKLIAAAILLGIGWIVGKVVGRVTKEIMRRLEVDQYISKGKKPVLKLSGIFSLIFSWAIYLVFIQAAVDALGIPTLASFFQSILEFLPGVIKAILVIVVGYTIAEYVRSGIEASGITYSELMGKTLFFLIIYIAVAMALPLVGIDPTLVNSLLLIIVGSIGVGIAIAIGLGLKDVVAEIVKKKFKV